MRQAPESTFMGQVKFTKLLDGLPKRQKRRARGKLREFKHELYNQFVRPTRSWVGRQQEYRIPVVID